MPLHLVDPLSLKLPACPLPRPGDQVCWFAEAHQVFGTLTGHDIDGRAVIMNQFGNGVTKTYGEIRLSDPFSRVGPNWTKLPAGGIAVKPNAAVSAALQRLLSQRVPPGPTYLDLVREIWSRGFETFLVGGTVRDLLSGVDGHDVDLVTTMPLAWAKNFLPSMYRGEPSFVRERGYISIGGSRHSGDPHIDLKVFSDSLPGTKEAVFGVGFERDVRHRDFACNAVYYDPINDVLVDPTGQGILDAQNRQLALICGSADAHQYAQIFIRTIKFAARGFTLTARTQEMLITELAQALPSMRRKLRSRYVQTQVLGKCSWPTQHRAAMQSFMDSMVAFGLRHVWEVHFEPIMDDIFDDRPSALDV